MNGQSETNDNQRNMVHLVNSCMSECVSSGVDENKWTIRKPMTELMDAWANGNKLECTNQGLHEQMNRMNNWMKKKRSNENTLMQTQKKWANDWVKGGIIHHSFIHEAGSSNPVRVGQMVSGTTRWCWVLTMTAEIKCVPVNEFPCKVSCSTCFFQGQCRHCAYKYDTWPLLSTNLLQIFRINQKRSVAINFRPTKPFCTFFTQNSKFWFPSEKKSWGGFFWTNH